MDADFVLPPTGTGPLTGVRFAVKDVFDIAGCTAGAGCASYARGRPAAVSTAPAIQRLLAAGAELRGITVTEEMMFGVLGQSLHGSPPPNPLARDRLPGGSSSGSASAVAAQLCEAALGTDTGGSVRVPASFCGICGMRPGRGQVSTEGVVPLAPRFDTVGWFARDPGTLAVVGNLLLGQGASAPPDWNCVWVPDEMTDKLASGLRMQVLDSASALADRLRIPLERAPLGSGPADWGPIYKVLQSLETTRVHGAWTQSAKAELGPLATARFAAAAQVTEAERPAAEAALDILARQVLTRLSGGTLLVAPTTPGPAPLRTAPASDLDAIRLKVLSRTAFSGLLGLAELSLPALGRPGAPVGLSLIAPPGTERALLGIGELALRWLVARATAM